MADQSKLRTSYSSNLDKAKNDAYFILSDSGQIKKGKINLQKLVSFHKAYTETIMFKDNALTGTVSNSNNELTLKTSERLSPLEESFEIATLLAMMISYNAKTQLEKNRMLPHKPNNDPHEDWLHAADVAMFILFYDVSPREFKALNHKHTEKLVSKLAKKKGLPTKYVLKRLSLEI